MSASGTSEDAGIPAEIGMERPFGIATGGLRPHLHRFHHQPLMRKDGIFLEGFDQGGDMILAASGTLMGLDEAGLMKPSLENGVLSGEPLVRLFGIDESEFVGQLFLERQLLFHGVL